MLIRKNYFLYNVDKEKKELAGSARLTGQEDTWKLELQWKEDGDRLLNGSDAVVLRRNEHEILLQSASEPLLQSTSEPPLQSASEPETSSAPQRSELPFTSYWEELRAQCDRLEGCEELGETYRIGKGDFPLLPEQLRHMLQNSFLIHGLMNYGYLILCRKDNGKETATVRLGVPGIYYEKEKIVAEMFGFDGFWCPEKSDNGKFGYYLRIVR